MAHEKQCQNCGRAFSGNITKRFCTDACRKYYKRHGETSLAGVKFNQNPDKAGLDRTTPRTHGGGIGAYAAKKGIDLLAKYAENTLLPQKVTPKSSISQSNPQPLLVLTAESIISDPMAELLRSEVVLPQDWREFLGSVSYPFKMLVWGLPGSGKSTFCMQLANHIARDSRLLYIAGEEDLGSQTLLDKQRRVITGDVAKNCVFLNRLPTNTGEWKQAMKQTVQSQAMFCNAIFYDSITQLDITPFYVRAAANDFDIPTLPFLSHIFITHAHKDGGQYRGDGSWGHEVDIIIRIEKGRAIIEKNRFGIVGRTLKVF